MSAVSDVHILLVLVQERTDTSAYHPMFLNGSQEPESAGGCTYTYPVGTRVQTMEMEMHSARCAAARPTDMASPCDEHGRLGEITYHVT